MASKKKKTTAWGENGFEDWGGYMAAKKAKLEEQFYEAADKEYKSISTLFNGISIFVNGYTDPTADELRRLMMEHGGTYHHYVRPKLTTHMIASNLPYSKIIAYRKAQNPVPICKPEWITDSIKAGSLLNFQNYLLYSNCTKNQPQLNFVLSNKQNNINIHADSHVNISEINEEQKPTVKEIPVKCNDARITHSSNNSEFISEFYNNSRLHHIATMGATFKDYVNELRDKSNGKFPGLDRLKSHKKPKQSELLEYYESDSDDDLFLIENNQATTAKQEPVIMHIDMDCFFVSVGLRNKPELRGLPVAVTHAKGNKNVIQKKSENTDIDNDEQEHGSLSEIASCSYEARKAGVKNGMFLGQALKICPNLKTIKYDFDGYKEVSYILYNTVATYTLNIEAVSCDEMYADCTKLLETCNVTPLEFATVIREEIKEKTGCPVSTGFGQNKLLARLATKDAKPDGQFYLKGEHIETYLGTLNVQDLPGVGYTTTLKLRGINVHTCAELQTITLGTLQKEFGKKMGELLYNMCRGKDNTKLNLEHVRKSVSAEVNYGIRFQNNGNAVDFLKKLCVEVCNRLKNINAKGRNITLKLMIRAKDAPIETAKFMGHGLCDYVTKSKNLISSVNDIAIVTKEVISLWNQSHQKPEDVRGIGIQITRLEILKNKCNDANLMNFVNKIQQPQSAHAKVYSDDCNVNQIIQNLNKTGQLEHKDIKTVSSSDNITSMNKNKPKEVLNSAGNQFLDNNAKNVIPQLLSVTEPSDNNIEESASTEYNLNENKSISQDKVVPSLNHSKTLIPSQNIDDSVLRKLPEDIKSEIKTIVSNKKILRTNNYEGQIKLQADKKGIELTNDLINLKSNILSECDNTKEVSKMNTEKCIMKDISSCKNKCVSNGEDVSESKIKSSLVVSQEIDEAVLNELPEDIKAEILIATSTKPNLSKNKVASMKSIQTSQEEFFREVKPSSGKSAKATMPPIQELDMSVLLELPEDIRNEIFNQYKSKDVNNKTNDSNNVNKQNIYNNINKRSVDEQDISFSQVDPEFLAALPEDMKHDVQNYCTTKKQERTLKGKTPCIFNGKTNGWNILRQEKPVKNPKVKSTSKIVKNNIGNKNNRKKNTKFVSTNKEHNIVHTNIKASEKTNDEIVTVSILNNKDHSHDSKNKLNTMDINKVNNSKCKTNKTVIHKTDVNEITSSIFHDKSIAHCDKPADTNQKILINIVNHLFDLPLEEVKMQIQTWISKSKIINEIDFLSLATFLSMLPEKKRIEDLHILLKTMHRCMTETGSCIWHRTYRKAVKHVQHYMQIEYNSDLMVPPIRCNCL